MKVRHEPARTHKISFSRKMLRLPKSIKFISLLMLIYYLGWGLVDPFLTIYFKEKLISYTNLSIVFAVFPLFSIAWFLLLGTMLDKFSKKGIINLTLLCYLPISLIILSLTKFSHFIFYRLYHSFVASSLWVSAESYVREHSFNKNRKEAFGFFDSIWGLALVIGPFLGGILISVLGYSLFYAVSIFSVLALIVSFFLPDNRKFKFVNPIKFINFKKEFLNFKENKPLIKVTIFRSLVAFSTAAVYMLLPLFLKETGANFFEIGVIISLFYLPVILESYFSTQDSKKMVIFGLTFGSLLFLLMFFVKNTYLLFFISILLGISFSSLIPNIQGRITKCISKDVICEMSSVVSSIKNSALVAGILLGGLISDFAGLRYIFLLSFAVFFILLLIILLSKKDVFNLTEE